MRGRKGQVLVEFALCLPLLMMIFGCVADLGFLLWKENVFAEACREGALYATLISPSAADWTSHVANYTARVKAYMLGATTNSGLLAGEITITPTAADAAMSGRDTVQVRIVHIHNFLTPFSFLGANNYTMTRNWKAMFVANSQGSAR